MESPLNFLKKYIRKTLEFFRIYKYIKKIIISLWKVKYHYKMISFFSQFLNRGDLCFDIGANIGQKTKIFLLIGAKVISVEPQKKCVIRLQYLYGRNKNVTIVNKAVGSKEGYGDIYICDEYHTLSTLSSKWKLLSQYKNKFTWSQSQRVKITTLDKLIEAYGVPKFCKIDVEGFEREVLKGLSKKIQYICFEFTSEFINEAKECIDHLLSFGPVKFNFVIGEGSYLALSKWVSKDKLYKAIEFLGDDLSMGDIYAKFF